MLHAVRPPALLALLTALGCTGVPGSPDPSRALEVVYDGNGVPAFAGQAMVIRSCGGGGFCHSDGLEDARDRFGAPPGLRFDLRIASVSNEAELDATTALLEDQHRLLAMNGEVWFQVSSGLMPPGDPDAADSASGQYFAALDEAMDPGFQFDRVSDDGASFTPLPGIRTEEGREIFRNWLRSGAPVVERTEPRVDREPNGVGTDLNGDGVPEAGFTVPICERTCLDATWPDIYERLLVPTCATSRCHDSSEPAAGLDLCNGRGETEDRGCGMADGQASPDPDAVLAALRDAPARSTGQCNGMGPLLDADGAGAGNAEGSLLWVKVAANDSDGVCGSRMPLSGNPLTQQRICALRTWIDCGGCADPEDAACSACVEAGRAACNIPSGGNANGECVTVATCSNTL